MGATSRSVTDARSVAMSSSENQNTNQPNTFWACTDCGTECWGGVSGQIGRGKKAERYCLKHYQQKPMQSLIVKNGRCAKLTRARAVHQCQCGCTQHIVKKELHYSISINDSGTRGIHSPDKCKVEHLDKFFANVKQSRELELKFLKERRNKK